MMGLVMAKVKATVNFLIDMVAMATFIVVAGIIAATLVWLTGSFVVFKLLDLSWSMIWFLMRLLIVMAVLTGIVFAFDELKEGKGKKWIE